MSKTSVKFRKVEFKFSEKCPFCDDFRIFRKTYFYQNQLRFIIHYFQDFPRKAVKKRLREESRDEKTPIDGRSRLDEKTIEEKELSGIEWFEVSSGFSFPRCPSPLNVTI